MSDPSLLRLSFLRARESGDIAEILPFFTAAQLFVAGKRVPTGDTPVFFAQRSPNPTRFCVTASEHRDVLDKHDVELIEHSGKSLLAAINPAHEIVIVYPDGGDYLTSEQLLYLRALNELE